MALTINTNISSVVAQRNLAKATGSLNKAIERMTTGYKINHAGDNAAGYSIARNWETQLGSLDVAADNAATGADMLSTLEDNYSLISSHLQRVRDLTEQAANGTYGKDSKIAIESEIKARLDEINRIAANCEFNGKHLMNGTDITAAVNLQVGLYSSTDSQIELAASLFADGSMTGLFKNMGSEVAVTGGKTLAQIMTATNADATVTSMNGTSDAAKKNLESFAAACAGLKVTFTGSGANLKATFDEQTAANVEAGVDPSKMLAFIDKALSAISTKATTLGAAQNRVESAIESIAVQSENITSSLSTLRDADVAEESSRYIQSQILQQAAATLLSTANQTPSIALNLI